MKHQYFNVFLGITFIFGGGIYSLSDILYSSESIANREFSICSVPLSTKNFRIKENFSLKDPTPKVAGAQDQALEENSKSEVQSQSIEDNGSQSSKSVDPLGEVKSEEKVSQILPTAPKSVAKPVAPKKVSGNIAPGLSAGYPLTYKKDEKGRLVCERKNDKPAKSTKGKSTHVDMECCLDPDEIPNPHCYYPADKYGQLLHRYNTEKKQLFIDRVKKK